jgi:tellurite resistance protein
MVTSRPPPPNVAVTFKPEQLELARRVRPFAEAMYLVIAVDSDVGERERDVLRGALRTLTDNLLSSAVLETMLGEFESARASEGIEQRLDAVASTLYWDPNDAELALELAIAAAEVDGRLDAREQSILHALAGRLGISTEHVDELLNGEVRSAGRQPEVE